MSKFLKRIFFLIVLLVLKLEFLYQRRRKRVFDNTENFLVFSKKVRLLNGIGKIEKEKLTQIYRIKKILKACGLLLEKYKNTKSFNEKNNFKENKITPKEK